MFVEKNGEIFQPDIFDGRFKPVMTSMRMSTYAYCSPGFGIMIDVASSKEKEYRCCTYLPVSSDLSTNLTFWAGFSCSGLCSWTLQSR